MTCIVGIAKGGKVWMGGDGEQQTNVKHCDRMPKVARVGQTLIGCAGLMRIKQIVHTAFLPPRFDGEIDQLPHWMSSIFVPELQQAIEANIAKRVEDEAWGLLVGLHGHLFSIDCSYYVGMPDLQYDAVGSGSEVALGALYAARNAKPEQRVRIALEAASKHAVAVGEPYTVLCVEDKDDGST